MRVAIWGPEASGRAGGVCRVRLVFVLRKGVVVRSGIWGPLLLIVPLLALGIAIGAPRPASAAQNCPGFVEGETIKGSLVVPTGVSCELYDVDVRGDISIAPGGSLQLVNSGVRGSVTGADITFVEILRTEVRGSIDVQGATLGATFVFSEVRGDLNYSGVAGEGAYLQDSTIRRSVTLNDNAMIYVIRVAVRGDLSCWGNGSVGADSGGSTVRGQRLGDCQNL